MSQGDQIFQSVMSKGFSNLVNLGFPGVGMIFGAVLSALTSRNDKNRAEISRHFGGNVITPFLNAMRAKDYAGALSLIDTRTGFAMTGGDSASEHLGYMLSFKDGSLSTAVFSAPLFHALQSGDRAPAFRIADFIDAAEPQIAARVAMDEAENAEAQRVVERRQSRNRNRGDTD